MKIKEKIKNMNESHKLTLVFTLIIIILLCIQVYFNILHINQYNDRVKYGNSRWEQIENRIKIYEQKIELLEKDIEFITKCQGGN